MLGGVKGWQKFAAEREMEREREVETQARGKEREKRTRGAVSTFGE